MVHALECPWPCSAEQHTYLRRIHVIILHSKTVRLFVSIRLCCCTLAAFVLHLQRDFPILAAHLPFCSTHLRPSSLCCSPESDSATRSLAWLLTIAWFLSKAWTANVGVCNLCVGQDVWTDLCTMSSVSCLPNNLHTFAWFVYIYTHTWMCSHTHTHTRVTEVYLYLFAYVWANAYIIFTPLFVRTICFRYIPMRRVMIFRMTLYVNKRKASAFPSSCC